MASVTAQNQALRIGPRVIVARTCPWCVRFLGAQHFNRNSAGYFDKVCSACRAAKARSNPRYRRVQSSSSATIHARLQSASQGSAQRHGAEWTGLDLEIAARADLSVSEIASMLGRSYYSVVTMRRAARASETAQG